MFSQIQKLPDDPILGLSKLYAEETNPNKIDLGVGVFRDETGKTPIMQAVKKAEELVHATQTSKAYLSSLGNKDFRTSIPKLILGEESKLLADGKLAVAQSPAGTGALRMAMEFVAQNLSAKKVWISNPSWSNHLKIAQSVGLGTAEYTYIDKTENRLNFAGLKQDIQNIPNGDVLLMHASCHNPTGFDLNFAQWQEIAQILEKKEVLLLLDSAYQGLGDGLDEDAKAMRLMAERLPNLMIAASCSKNFGLYRDRIGALMLKTANVDETQSIETQLADIARGIFSSPPDHGAAVVATILQSPDLTKMWQNELNQMRDRTLKLRTDVVAKFEKVGLGDKFGIIAEQKGMFSFTGLTAEQVERLQKEFAIYLTRNGRINVAGLNTKNMDYFVESVCKVV